MNWISFTEGTDLHTSSQIQNRFHEAHLWTPPSLLCSQTKNHNLLFLSKALLSRELPVRCYLEHILALLWERIIPRKRKGATRPLSCAARVATPEEVFASDLRGLCSLWGTHSSSHQSRGPALQGPCVLRVGIRSFLLGPWNQQRSSTLSPEMLLGHLQARGWGAGSLCVALVCGDTCHFFYHEVVLHFKVLFFFTFIMEIFCFLFLIKIHICLDLLSVVSAPSALLPPSLPRAWPPWPQTPAKAFLLLGFSLNRSEIAAPVVFLKINFVMVKKNQDAFLHSAF